MIHKAGAGRFGGGADSPGECGGPRAGGSSERACSPGPASPLAIALFGAFDVRVQGHPLPRPRTQKTHWLLALLALQEGRALERDWLAGTLWPDSTEEQAARNLRTSLWDLRQALGPEAHRLEAPTTQSLRLDLVDAEADLLIFDEAIARGDALSLEQAVALHRGPLLQGCDEEWVLPDREAREQAYLAALETLAADALTRGEPTAAARHLRRLLAVDPLRENVQRTLMQALAAAGEYAAVTQTYRDLRVLLHHELNTAPSPETTALYQQLRAQASGRADSGVQASGRSGVQADNETPDGVKMPASSPPERPNARTPERLNASPPALSNLPRPVSSFVGRVREVQEIAASLAGERLVTLTGPGGVGKTRLAIQVGGQVAEEYADGVCFVELAALADGALVAHAVARALGAAEQPDRPLIETLQELLCPRELLLVLDNCEHLLDACAPLIETLLQGCPDLRVLATSRQSLGIGGEIAWRVPPLSLPEASGVRRQASEETSGVRRQASVGDETDGPCRTDALRLTPDALLQSEALRLFVERGTAARQSFALTVENAGAVLQLCRRLDGIPLALELAAARLQALSVEQILTRLEDRFRLLADGARTAPPRQQTLRAALDWSYTLLTDAERILIHRLSIFAGGWTLEAAEAVCGEEGLGCWGLGLGDGAVGGTPPDQDTTSQDLRPKPQDLRPYGVLDLLTALVDKSLVQYEEPGEGKSGRDTRRYRLLETVRQYARERLLESGEAEAVRDRHLAFYLPLAEDAACHLRGPGQLAALERLDTEHDNLRAALDWSLTEGRNQKVVATDREGATDSHQPRLPSAFCLLPSAPEAAFRLAGALAGFWEVRGHVEEGRRRLAAVLDQTAPPDAAPNPKSRIQNPKSQQPRRRSHAAAVALEGAGALAILQWDYAAARAHYTESLEIRRALDDRRGVARSLGRLGLLAFEQGDGPDAYAQLQESLGIARELGDPAGLSGALGTLAHVAFRQGDILWARALLEESLAIERELGDPAGIALALTGLAEIVHHLEEYPLARALEEESLAIGRVLGDRRRVAESLVLLGNTLYAQQEYAAARTHLEEALAIQRALGDGRRAAEALDALANMARRQGDYAAGRRFAEECVALWRATGAQVGVIHALGVLGHLARATREYRQAHTAYSESLRLRDEGQHLYLVINGLEDFADLANDQEQWERAMRLLGAALAQREAAGKPLLPRERADYDAIACRARGALAEEVVAAAFSDGQGMTREQAIAYALAAPPLDEEEAEVTETAHPPRADAIGPLRVVSAGSAQ